jgi:hypothetical protein
MDQILIDQQYFSVKRVEGHHIHMKIFSVISKQKNTNEMKSIDGMVCLSTNILPL